MRHALILLDSTALNYAEEIWDIIWDCQGPIQLIYPILLPIPNLSQGEHG